jgi:cellulose synthase/poly-beta-1,6-N-acetylglucosamine synthase-like glycosyltransferase
LEFAVNVFEVLYLVSAVLLSVTGFHAITLSVLYLLKRNQKAIAPSQAGKLPTVVIQLPIYNERYVVERLIEAAARIDYPAELLTIQVLDDSTDDTVAITAAAIEKVRRMGIDISHIRRADRGGYKAGALAEGLRQTSAEFVVIFDADFVPQPDFLQTALPHFTGNPRLGLVQTRWAHLNAEYSLLTRAEAQAIDTHFLIEQTARNRNGLLINFAGTGGIWRRTCIEDSGGWHADTLSEDIDLSFRAQLRGWGCLYLPEVSTPGEIPPLMMGYKRQQARWAMGTVQCLRKMGGTVLKSSLSLAQKVEAVFHLTGYFIHPLLLILMLTALPVVLTRQVDNLPLAGLGLAMFGPPLQALITQRTLYTDWKLRMLYFPMLMVLGAGMAVNNTIAVIKGLTSKEAIFQRTPKYQSVDRQGTWSLSSYTIPIDHTVYGEIFMAVYAVVTGVLAYRVAPALSVFMVIYACGFVYVAATSLYQALASRRVPRMPELHAPYLESREGIS